MIRTDAVGYRITCTVDTTLFTDLLVASPERARPPRRARRGPGALGRRGARRVPPRAVGRSRGRPARRAAVRRGRGPGGAARRARPRRRSRRRARGPRRASTRCATGPAGCRSRPWRATGARPTRCGPTRTTGRSLAEETGTEPSALVRSIERRVAAGWSGDEDVVDDGAALDLAPSTSRLAGALARGSLLIGRRRELTWLESELVQARTGELRIVLVSGEAGIGKTTLLAAFARNLDGNERATVVYGRCDDGGRRTAAAVPRRRGHARRLRPEGGAARALRALRRRAGPARAAPAQPRVGAAADRAATTRPSATSSSKPSPISCAGSRPAARSILVLEDLHWAEPTALLLLRHLARALVDAPVLVLASLRETRRAVDRAASPPSPTSNAGTVRRIALAGFDDAELVRPRRVGRGGTDARPAGDVLEQLRDADGRQPAVRRAARPPPARVRTARGRRRGPALRRVRRRPALPTEPARRRLEPRAGARRSRRTTCSRPAAVLGIEFDEDTLVEMTDVERRRRRRRAGRCPSPPGCSPRPTRRRRDDALHARARRPRALRGARRLRRRRRCTSGRPRSSRRAPTCSPQSTVVELARHWALAGDRARRATVGDRGGRRRARAPRAERGRWPGTTTRSTTPTALERPEAERADSAASGEHRATHGPATRAARDTLLEAAALARRSGADDVLIRAALATDRGLGRIGTVDAEQLAIIEAAIEVADPDDTATLRAPPGALRPAAHPHPALRAPPGGARVRRSSSSTRATTRRCCSTTIVGARRSRSRDRGRCRAGATSRCGRSRRPGRAEDPVLGVLDAPRRVLRRDRVGRPGAGPDEPRPDRRRSRPTSGNPACGGSRPSTRPSEATMEARLDDAERLAEDRARRSGPRSASPRRSRSTPASCSPTRSFAGRYAELFPLAQGIMEASPDMRAVPRSRTRSRCLSVDREDEARAILRQGADDEFAAIPRRLRLDDRGHRLRGARRRAAGRRRSRPSSTRSSSRSPTRWRSAARPARARSAPTSGSSRPCMGRHDEADAHLHAGARRRRSRSGGGTTRPRRWSRSARSQQRRTGALDRDADAVARRSRRHRHRMRADRRRQAGGGGARARRRRQPNRRRMVVRTGGAGREQQHLVESNNESQLGSSSQARARAVSIATALS